MKGPLMNPALDKLLTAIEAYEVAIDAHVDLDILFSPLIEELNRRTIKALSEGVKVIPFTLTGSTPQ
jgi:hypothetical protein